MRSCAIPVVLLSMLCATSPAHARDEHGGVSGGAATYSMELPVPGAKDTFHPNVSIEYSSRSGNGRLGMGWWIWASESTVHRCPATTAMDRYSQEVSYTSTDRLCIDGQHMLPVIGRYGKDGSIYRTERDEGVMVKLHGDVNAADAWFEAIDGDGGRREFRVRSVPSGAPAALTWHVTRRSQAGDAPIEYDYQDNGAGQQLLQRVRYGGEAAGTAANARYFIRLVHAARSNVLTEWLHGGETRLASMVTGIRLGRLDAGREETLDSYAFAYGESRSSGRPLLQTITHCKGEQDAGHCDAPTRVTWLDAPIAFSAPVRLARDVPATAVAAAWVPGQPRPAIGGIAETGDINVDGRSDLIERHADGSASAWIIGMDEKRTQVIPIANAGAFLGSLQTPVVAADLRHMGGADLLGTVDGALAIVSWRNQGFTAPQSIGIAEPGDRVVMDVDQDGAEDLLIGERTASGYRIVLRRNVQADNVAIRYAEREAIAEWPTTREVVLQRARALDGMGRAAMLTDAGKPVAILLFTSDEDGRVRASLITPQAYGIHPDALASDLRFADIDGDGLNEIVYPSPEGRLMVQVNRGNGFAPPTDAGIVDPRMPGTPRVASLVTDYDSDGWDEILYPARRVTDYCIRVPDGDPVCGDALSRTQPDMDFGIYAYAAIGFHLDADGRYLADPIVSPGVIGQANRMYGEDLRGDGVEDYVSPFDRGVENGGFVGRDGALVACPPTFGCGLAVASMGGLDDDERRDTPLDFAASVKASRGTLFEWHYYPLSSSREGLYAVPDLDSPARYLGTDRFYFTSSMYVVGESLVKGPGFRSRTAYGYGGAAYNNQGRGFTGFQWILVDDGKGTREGTWFRQEFPYWGTAEFTWVEDSSDRENDYVHGSPGRRYRSRGHWTLGCSGPADHPLTRRFQCKVNESPGFVIRTPYTQDD